MIKCLLLYARFLTFRCKTANNIPNLSVHYLAIENAKTVEKRSVRKKKKIDAYRKKWSMILQCNAM